MLIHPLMIVQGSYRMIVHGCELKEDTPHGITCFNNAEAFLFSSAVSLLLISKLA